MKLRLKEILAEKGMSRAELARRMGKRQDIEIRRWANGVNFPSKKNLAALCEVLECSMSELVELDPSRAA